MSKKAEKPENIKLAKNIKYFRELNGESQWDLALALGFDSKSTISMYENGGRVPNAVIVSKIAEHYRITENELKNGVNFSLYDKISVIETLATDKKWRSKFADMIMPVLCSDKALENKNFKKAYELTLSLKETSIKGTSPVFDINELVDNYAKSLNLKESIANLLSVFIYFEIGIHNLTIIKGAEKLQADKIDINRYYKDYVLINDDVQYLPEDFGIEHCEIEEHRDKIENLLVELRKDNDYAFLVNYFIAIRYIFNCIDNGQPRAVNSIVGVEMLDSEESVHNPYAIKFYTELSEFIT